jgi:hypothetical protein
MTTTNARKPLSAGFTPTKPGRLPVTDGQDTYTVSVTGGDMTYEQLRLTVTARGINEATRKMPIPGSDKFYTRKGALSGVALNDYLPLPDGSMPAAEPIIDPELEAERAALAAQHNEDTLLRFRGYTPVLADVAREMGIDPHTVPYEEFQRLCAARNAAQDNTDPAPADATEEDVNGRRNGRRNGRTQTARS